MIKNKLSCSEILNLITIIAGFSCAILLVVIAIIQIINAANDSGFICKKIEKNICIEWKEFK